MEKELTKEGFERLLTKEKIAKLRQLMTDGRNSQPQYETRNPGLTGLGAAGTQNPVGG